MTLNKLCEDELRECPLIELRLTLSDRVKKNSAPDVIGSVTNQEIIKSPVSVLVIKNR